MAEFFDDNADELELEFNKAAEHLQNIVSEVDQGNLLELYGFYKQATVGNCNISKPGIFSLQAKAKWSVWNNLKNMSKIDAMNAYIEKLSSINPKWNAEKKKGKDQQWVSVSQHKIGEDDCEIPESDKTSFDFVKEGKVEQLKNMLLTKDVAINDLDETGLGLMHWAADRGYAEILFILLQHEADVNLKDTDGQTPLHYASSIGHIDCVKLLLKHGANRNIKDNDLQTCLEVASDENILELLKV